MIIEDDKILFDSYKEAIEFKEKLNKYLSENSPLSLSMNDEPSEIEGKYYFLIPPWLKADILESI
ncbi:MAG: hypothetical protein GYA14_16210 [Ignavibacteria bacterium]|nr:hypothetical protein [Ignavibacteria bacterium]